VTSIVCSRCRQQRDAVENVPYAGDLGEEIRQRVCAICWTEWQQAEVIVINELRLDFMDPKSHDILLQHLREFFGLDGEPSPTP